MPTAKLATRQRRVVSHIVAAACTNAELLGVPLVGQEAAVILDGDATESLFGDTAATHEGVGGPPARNLLADLRDHEVPVYALKGCAVAREATDEDLARVAGSWVSPPEAARLFADGNRVVTF